MPSALTTVVRPLRPDAAAVREWATTADPGITPAVISTHAGEIACLHRAIAA